MIALALLLSCVDADGDGFTVAEGDCDDADPQASPGHYEQWYDGVDNDCSGGRDRDQDGDGADSWRVGGRDCYDTPDDDYPRPLDQCWREADLAELRPEEVFPSAIDVPYDGTDADCSGGTDGDGDGDGFTICEADEQAADCDDTDAAVYPGAEEGLADGVDSDCDGQELCHADADADGFGDTTNLSYSPTGSCRARGYSSSADDCNDHEARTYPGAVEWCDRADNDCDGDIADEAGTAMFQPEDGKSSDVTALLVGEYTVATGELWLCAGTWPVSLVVNEPEVTIRGVGRDSTFVVPPEGTALVVTAGPFSASDLSFTGATEGGVSLTRADASFESVAISDNSSRWGAGLAAWGGRVSVVRSVLSGNVAEYGGGGIYASEAHLALHNTEVRDNSALDGGGIYASDTAVVATSCTITGNVAGSEGAALYGDHATVRLATSNIDGNEATNGGGGAWLAAGKQDTLTSEDSTWGSNRHADVESDIDGYLLDAPLDYEGVQSFSCDGRLGCW